MVWIDVGNYISSVSLQIQNSVKFRDNSSIHQWSLWIIQNPSCKSLIQNFNIMVKIWGA